jgi:hypothetical protein
MTTDIFVFICKTDLSKPVKQEVNGTVMIPPLVFPVLIYLSLNIGCKSQGAQGCQY